MFPPQVTDAISFAVPMRGRPVVTGRLAALASQPVK